MTGHTQSITPPTPANPKESDKQTVSGANADSDLSGFSVLLSGRLNDDRPLDTANTRIDSPTVTSGLPAEHKKNRETGEARTDQTSVSLQGRDAPKGMAAITALLNPQTVAAQASAAVVNNTSGILVAAGYVEPREEPPPGFRVNQANVGNAPGSLDGKQSFKQALTVDAGSMMTGELKVQTSDVKGIVSPIGETTNQVDTVAQLGISSLTYTRMSVQGVQSSQSSGSEVNTPSSEPSNGTGAPSAAVHLSQPKQVNPAVLNMDTDEQFVLHPKITSAGPSPVAASGQRNTVQAAELVAAYPADIAQNGERLAAPTRMTMASSSSQIHAITAPNNTAMGEGNDGASRERQPSPEAANQTILSAQPGSTGSSSEAKGTGPLPTTLSDRVQVVNQLAHRLETMHLSQGRHEVVMHLKPEHMGELHLTITADRDKVTTRITADTPLIRQAVQEGREQLRIALEDKGFTLQGFDVALNQGGSEHRFAPFNPVQDTTASRSSGRVSPVVEQQPGLIITPQRMNLRDGRLDYQA